MSNRISVLVGLGYSSERPLDMSEETSGLFDSLDSKKVDVRYLPNLTFQKLEKKFNSPEDSHQIRIFHYIGHSSLKGIQVEENGQIIQLSKERLVDLLKPQKLQFVFLNSCLSKEIAKDLHEAGIPVVIGTSESVDNEDAIKIATYFYEALSGQKGRTLIDAFSLTSNHFKALQEQNKSTLKSTFNFRGLGKREDETQDFAWNIYAENASEVDKNWCLIPTGKFVLREARDDLRKKVFCLYGKQIRDYYTPIQLHGGQQLNIITGGIWDINENEDVSVDDFLTEWKAADVILHFLDGNYGELHPFINAAFLQGSFTAKQHIFVKVDESYGLATAFVASVFDEKRTFPSSKSIGSLPLHTLKNIETTLRFDKMTLFQNIFCKELPGFLELQLNEIDLCRDLEELDFESEKKNFIAGKPKLFFTLIEGSADCAQTLLVKTIKKRMGILSNVEIKVLKIGQNPVIQNELSFWFSLIQLLQTVPSDPNMGRTCAQAILDKKEPFVLVFDKVDIGTAALYQKAILNDVWQELLKLYHERQHTGGYELKNPVMIFTLNYDEHFLNIPAEANSEIIQVEKISPVSKLSEGEFNEWYAQKELIYRKINPDFETNIKNKKVQIVNARRKIAMINICESISPTVVRIVEDQVLKLS